jgi:hypothetical protein
MLKGGEISVHEFLIFYAPVMMVMVSILAAFWIAPKDESIK